MRARRWLAWTVATTGGYALGMTVSGSVTGAVARPLSPLAGGIVFVFAYGALIGIFLGAAQLLAMARGTVDRRGWLLATAIGAGVGFAVASLVGEFIAGVIDPTVNVVVGEGTIEDASGAVVGLAIGFAQWGVLRPLLPAGRRWLIASTVGGLLGYGSAAAVLELFELTALKANVVPSYGAILGIFIGVAQGLVISRLSSARVHA